MILKRLTRVDNSPTVEDLDRALVVKVLFGGQTLVNVGEQEGGVVPGAVETKKKKKKKN
jgi:hypothetical protein